MTSPPISRSCFGFFLGPGRLGSPWGQGHPPQGLPWLVGVTSTFFSFYQQITSGKLMYECHLPPFVLRFNDPTRPFIARDLGCFWPFATGAILGPGIPQGTPRDTQGWQKINPVQQITMGNLHSVCYFSPDSQNTSGKLMCDGLFASFWRLSRDPPPFLARVWVFCFGPGQLGSPWG